MTSPRPHPGLIVANLKTLCTAAQTDALVHDLRTWYPLGEASPHVVVCPQLPLLSRYTSHPTPWSWGAQAIDGNLYPGPYTGSIAAPLVAELGVSYALVGHKETVEAHHLTIEDRVAALSKCITAGITPLICIDRDEYSTLLHALQVHLSHTPPLPRLILAYEPAHAINADHPDTIEEIVTVLEEVAAAVHTYGFSESILLYGGSVTESLAAQLAHTRCGGLLIGRASTDSHSFKKIVSSWYTTRTR